jgi:hypothetical protein
LRAIGTRWTRRETRLIALAEIDMGDALGPSRKKRRIKRANERKLNTQ